jgi:hypothetical protein
MGSEEVSKEEKEGTPVKYDNTELLRKAMKQIGVDPELGAAGPGAEKDGIPRSGLKWNPDSAKFELPGQMTVKRTVQPGARSTATRLGNVSSRRGTSKGKGFVMDQSEGPKDWKFVSNEEYDTDDPNVIKRMGRTVVFALVAGKHTLTSFPAKGFRWSQEPSIKTRHLLSEVVTVTLFECARPARLLRNLSYVIYLNASAMRTVLKQTGEEIEKDTLKGGLWC